MMHYAKLQHIFLHPLRNKRSCKVLAFGYFIGVNEIFFLSHITYLVDLAHIIQ